MESNYDSLRTKLFLFIESNGKPLGVTRHEVALIATCLQYHGLLNCLDDGELAQVEGVFYGLP